MDSPNSLSRGSYIPSPKDGGIYHKLKFYDKLSTMNPELNLKLPAHIFNPTLFYFSHATKQTSWMTIFSIWNTMIGSTVLTMPWGVEQAGLLMAIGNSHAAQILLVGCIALYTCSLVAKYCKQQNEDDVVCLVREMWGTKGEKLTLIMSCSIFVGATMAFNVLMNSSFFNVLKGLSIWITGNEISSCDDCWEDFSARYTPFILMGLLMFILNFKEKSTYIKLNSGGIFFVLAILVFLISVGIRALALNTFTLNHESISSSDKKCSDDWNCLKHSKPVEITLYEPNFLMLGGILTLSFFLHNCIAIMLKNNEHQEKNGRDLALGYLAAGSSYMSIAVIGYFGFKGNGFPQSAITQNALDMFAPTNPLAFIFRIILLTQMLTVYPMVIYFVRIQFMGYFYGSDYPSKKHIFVMSLVISSLTTLVASIYPNVGLIVGFVGAFCGFYFTYLLPVCFHIRFSRPKVEESPNPSVMKIAMKEEDMTATKKPPRSLLSWKIDIALHMLLILFGIVVMLFQFIKV
jgi:solute carrier family 38 (sodium-coupled neutral amino acid transporter), member 9